MRTTNSKLRFAGNIILEFPMTSTFFILLIVLLYRSSNSEFKTVVVTLVGEDSALKTLALIISSILVMFWEIFYKNTLLVLRSKKKGKAKSIFVKLDKASIRFCLITISVNYFFVLSALEYEALASKILSFFGILGLHPNFADLRTTLLGISCLEVNRIGDYISCGDRGNNWTYPSILLNLRGLDINESAAPLMMFAMLITITFFLYRLSRHLAFVPFILLLSLLNLSPFLIVIERGNLDLLIFLAILIVVSILNNSSISRWALILCAFLIFMAALLKFYPLIGITPLVYLSLKKIKQFGRSTLIIIMTFGLVALLVLLPDLSRLWRNEVIDLSGSIGLGNIVALASGLGSTKTVDAVSSLLIFILMISIFHKKLWAETAFYSNLNVNTRTQLLLTSLIASAPWLTTTNYYYRLIMLWPLIYCLFRLSTQTSLDLSSITQTILFPTILSNILVFRTFAIVQNIALIPIYLIAVFFVARELVEIKSQLDLKGS